MVRFYFVLICVFVLQFCKANCQDKNWIMLAGGEHYDSYYLNIRNMVKTDTTVLVWTERVLCKESLKEKPGYNIVKMRILFDLKNNKVKDVASYRFLNDNCLNTYIYGDFSFWRDIMPDTFVERELLVAKKYLHMKN